MNRDVLHSLASKAGFGDLMTQPRFVDMLGRYTNLLEQRIQKHDQSAPKFDVRIEMKSLTSKGLVVLRKNIDIKVFKTMPVEMLTYHFGSFAVEFKEQLNDPN